MTHPEQPIADGVCNDAPLYFTIRALPGYVNRWLSCEAVKLELSATGEAQLIVRSGIVAGMDMPATDDGVSDRA